MTELPFAEILRPELADLHAYLPVLGDYRVRLDANEAPNLLSAGARKRLAEAAAETVWERYPDVTASELRNAIAAHCGITKEEVLVGVGSDEVIGLLLTVLSKPRLALDVPSVLTMTPTFVMYRLSARVRGMRAVEVPLDATWDISVEAVKRGIEIAQPNLIFIATPNNPTGNMASRERVEAIIEAAPNALVVIDEAYINYAHSDHLDLYRKYQNVAILRTLSKIGFAALRLGWIIGRPALIHELDKVRLPYNINSITQRLATLALTELLPEIANTIRSVVAERERVNSALAEVSSVSVTESQANFLWIKTEKPAKEIFEGLAASSILVRSFHERGGRLANQLRVTLGTRSENDAFLNRLRELV